MLKRFTSTGCRLSRSLAVHPSQCRPLYSHYSTLLLAEHQSSRISPSTLCALSAASQMKKSPIYVMVYGGSQETAQSVAKCQGVDKVFWVKGSDKYFNHPMPESVSVAFNHIYQNKKDLDIDTIVSAHSVWGKDVLPRLGAMLDVQPISDVVKIIDDSTFIRPIYASNAMCQIKSSDKIKVITFRPTAFDKLTEEKDSPAEIEEVQLDDSAFEGVNVPEFVSESVSTSERPDLGSARVVVSGGRGLQNGENFKILYELADQLGGAVGATRAVVEAGFVTNDLQVGQTGKVVAPELYIACGISGQIQHIAGMKDSKCIVAINKDAEAPIFQVSDYGIVKDLFEVVPELTEKIKASK